jgi:hypothetical protein
MESVFTELADTVINQPNPDCILMAMSKDLRHYPVNKVDIVHTHLTT